MAKTKAGGTSRNGRSSGPQYLGVKKFDGEKVQTGSIIIRQRGNKFLTGNNVKKGNDYTIYSMKDGVVKFQSKKKKLFNGSQRMVRIVNVE
ncbi:MAG: 50S ribosomal protein L27 [Patescibacteria group bacterium]